MNVEKLAEEYLRQKALNESLQKQLDTMKGLLTKAIDEDGDQDEKGHRWLVAGRFLLQRQKRQGKKYLNREAAEQWAREEGFWDQVKVVREELDEDALLGYVFERRKAVEGIEDRLESMYVTPEPTWAFQQPVEQENYEY
jgi:hypothetical protein